MKLNVAKETGKKVAEIASACNAYTSYLMNFGNECAHTDRIVEHIIELAVQLSKITDNQDICADTDPLRTFCRNEAKFRLQELFEEDYGLTDAEILQIGDSLWQDSDVMFDYDAIDNYIAREARMIINERKSEHE